MDNFDGYIADLYRQIEIELISSMKRNLALHLAEEQVTGIKYPQWQAVKLKELKRFQRENARIIGRKTKGLSKEVSEHMQSELKEGASHEFKVYRDALGKGYKSAKKVKDSFFKVDDEKVKGMINALNNDLSTANSAMFRTANDTYRQVIYKYSFFMANGTYTYKKAYDAAVKDFLERGINCIEYKDGRRVNIADYCKMAVRTASQRAYMTGQGEARKKIGNPLIIITKHNTSCKLCKPFERKVLIDDVYSGGTKTDGEYMLLSEAIEKGLYHPNCRHGSDTYYREREEFFEEYYKTHPENNSADDEGEENSTAHIENMVQKYRRLSEGSIDEENVSKYQILLDEWQDKKAEIVDKSGESGIINAGAISGALDPDSDEAFEHAERYYAFVRSITADVNNIAKHTGFSVDDIQIVKNFIFIDEHDLGDGVLKHFYPSYDMAQSWQRLIQGKNIQKHDITLIQHELLEHHLMSQGLSQEQAHIEVSKKYDYKKECDEFNAEIKRNKNKR